MNKKMIEQQLKQTFDHASDGLFEDILADCHKERMLTGMNMNETIESSETTDLSAGRNRKRRLVAWSRQQIAMAAVAALIILILGALFAMQQLQVNQVATLITLDLNPGIELSVNKDDKVLSVKAINDKGHRVLRDLRLEKTDLNVAINAIIGSMLQSGYLTKDSNTFLVSVDNPSEPKSAALLNLIASQLETLLTGNSLDGLVISQNLAVDDDLRALANQYGISAGKASLASQIHEQYPDLPMDALAAMEIGELAQLFSQTIAGDDAIDMRYSDHDDDDRELIDRASVLTRLAERWGIDPAGILDAKIDLDDDDDQPVYVIEYKSGTQVWRAVVDALTGAILSEDDPNAASPTPTLPPAATPAPQPEATPTPEQKPLPAATPTETAATSSPMPTKTPAATPTSTQAPQQQMLSAAAARRMVLDRFGGIIQKIEYTYDDRNPLYKGEALKEGYRVVFEINARTSGWVKWDVGNDNAWDSFSHALPDMITIDEAARSVVDKSGQSNTFVQKIDFLWDDEKPLYQGEAFNKGVKYSFEIYAYGGHYQKWTVSTGDETWFLQYDNVR